MTATVAVAASITIFACAATESEFVIGDQNDAGSALPGFDPDSGTNDPPQGDPQLTTSVRAASW